MTLHCGDLFDVLPTLPAESIDACVCDPPYGIGFMNRKWDTFAPGVVAQPERYEQGLDSDNPNLRGRHRSPAISPSQIVYDRTLHGQREFQAWTTRWATEVLRVLKPGGYLVVCGAPRSYHRMACGLEEAGAVIRDCPLYWGFGQGFPKSLNLGNGRGTALKPAYEPIALTWKPFKGSLTATLATYGTGALNIEACRVEEVEGVDGEDEPSRWPGNVILDENTAALLDERTGDLVSRFYYVAKPSREERDFGCECLPARSGGEATYRKDGSAGLNSPRAGAGRTGGARNTHPTVKPIALMRWLVRLVTPPGGTVLDPFCGSGTVGMSCRYEQRGFIGVEREAEYVEIAERRIAAVAPLFGDVV